MNTGVQGFVGLVAVVASISAGVVWYSMGIWWVVAIVLLLGFLVTSGAAIRKMHDLHNRVAEPRKMFASYLLTRDKLSSVTTQLLTLASQAVSAEKSIVMDAAKPLGEVIGQLSYYAQAYPQIRSSEHYGVLLGQVRQLADEMHGKAEEYNGVATLYNHYREFLVAWILGFPELGLLTECSEEEIVLVRKTLKM